MDYPSSYGQFIYQGKACAIFKVDAPEGDFKKIRKILPSDSPESYEEKCFENEFKLTHDLHIPGVRKAISLHNQDGALVLELEYFEGITIKEMIISDPLDLTVFLKIAIEITNALESLHQLHIVHKNLSSENILVNYQNEIQLIDFGLAGKTHQISNDVDNLEQLERSLAYISPEQTGRLHREVDERSDLYSLGVIFYEMLTGKLPFEGKDSLELVYANFIRIPIAPHVIRNVPQVLSEIILKLLEKNPDDRYQSGFGVKHDLKACLIQLEKGGEINAFPLAKNDFSRKFKLPQELYGREKEKAQLLQLFERACSGPAQIVFISGYSGVGKTALVQELSKNIPERRGCFISGKFDQYQRDTPYYAWIQAFEAFVTQALTGSVNRMEYWKEKITNAVRPHGKLLTDVIGHLETLIGKQPEINKINPVDSQFRFNQTVINFIKALSTKEHPFFIFVDDWQWADLPSLDLLKVLATDPEIQFVMIVGTYRENEVDTTHPLVRRMHEIKMQNRVTLEIKLPDLLSPDVAQLIADTLNASVESCQPFAKLIYTKTQGNPFFLRQILYTIYQANLLQFNPAKQSWDWELEKIRQLNITDNVVGLMAEKVLRLPKASQHVLKLSSCIGTLFNLTTLSVIYEKPAAETAKDLLNPLQDGLIIQIKDNYKFAHDRIQQAVYSLIPEQDRKLFHLQIGRLLLQNVKQQGENKSLLDGQLFDIVSHLNVGRKLIKSEKEKIQLAQLNLKAGLKAKSATAFQSAASFFKTGIILLPKDAWQIHYDLTFQLYEECAECEFLIAQEAESEKHYSILLRYTKTALKKADILSTQVWQYIGVYRLEEAYKKATLGLQLCGIDIPKTEKELKLQSIQIETEIENLSKYQSFHKFIDASLVTDPVQIVRMKNFYTMACQSYITSNGSRFKFCVLKGIALSLRYGQFDLSPNMFGMYCRILAEKDLYRQAYGIARLAIDLADSNTKAREGTQAYSRAGLWGFPYGEPLKKSIPVFIKGAEVGWEMGDLVQSGASHLDISIHMFHQGNPLKEVEKYADKAVEYNKKVNFKTGMDASQIEKRLASYLQSRDPACDLSDASFPVKQINRINSNMIDGFLWFNRIQVKFWFEAYEEAYQISRDKLQLFHLETNIKWADYDFFHAITCAQLLQNASLKSKMDFKQEIFHCYTKIKLRAEACAANFLHKQLLIEAEMARMNGRKWEAAELYDQSIAEAKRHGFTHIEALANELAAKYWKDYEKHDFAGLYFKNARQIYLKWGSVAKLKDLEDRYPRYFIHMLQLDEVGHMSQRFIQENDEKFVQGFNLRSVIKSIQAISSETVLSNLLEKVMPYVVQHAGAEKGVLIENKEDQLTMLATVNSKRMVQVLQGMPVEESKELPLGIVHFVARTQQPILLDNASQNARYAHDPYIQSNQPLSVLCFPIIRKEKLQAIFYLENNLTEGVFSIERLELLKIISSQVGISLENALLYENRLELEKIHEIDKAKSIFFANISHEFRTPLTLILGLAQKIKEGSFGENEKDEQCTVILRNAERLLQLINQLLDLSKLEAKSMRLEVAEVSVSRLIDGIIQVFAPLANQKNINFKYHFPHKKLMGFLDADKLVKILSNLLGNAFKFTPENGQVWLEVKVKDKDKDWLKISIKDTGPGIAQKDIDSIFDRFSQAEASHEHGMTGSGLGLALTRELVELHKGKIAVKSESGKGVVFTFDLPVGRAYYTFSEIINNEEKPLLKKVGTRESKQPKDLKVSKVRHSKGRKQILVVEDHQDLRHFIAGILKDDFKISEAKDGEEGLEIAIKEIPDLVISDIMMPKMDGYSLCHNLKLDERTSHIPVILLTAKADVYSKLEGLETGADDYVTKPFNEQELGARVKNLIQQRERLKVIFSQNLHIAPQLIAVNSQDQRFIKKVMEITEDQISNPQFGVEEFCIKIGMSRSQFYRKLLALTGFSANEFIREMRLKRAAALIESDFGSITDIAYETGFNTLSYFSKCFQQRFGQSPKAYSKPFNADLSNYPIRAKDQESRIKR